MGPSRACRSGAFRPQTSTWAWGPGCTQGRNRPSRAADARPRRGAGEARVVRFRCAVWLTYSYIRGNYIYKGRFDFKTKVQSVAIFPDKVGKRRARFGHEHDNCQVAWPNQFHAERRPNSTRVGRRGWAHSHVIAAPARATLFQDGNDMKHLRVRPTTATTAYEVRLTFGFIYTDMWNGPYVSGQSDTNSTYVTYVKR